MGPVDGYIDSLPPGADRAELERLHSLISGRVRDVGQTVSYQMPCYTYRDVPLRFTASTPLPDDLVAQLLDIRMCQIDERSTT